MQAPTALFDAPTMRRMEVYAVDVGSATMAPAHHAGQRVTNPQR